MKNFNFQSLMQLALLGGFVAMGVTTLVIHGSFRGLIEIQVGPQGGRLTIDSRQLADKAEPPQIQAIKK